jgi:beta-galactosidase
LPVSANVVYLAGGTNFGFWAGANVDSEGNYQPHITSYDYHAPISEAGDYCQPGIGGDGCKFHLVKDVIAEFTGIKPAPTPPRPVLRSYGDVAMTAVASLLQDAHALAGPPLLMQFPKTMEEMGQRWGLVLYRTSVPAKFLSTEGSLLDVGAPVHDYATVFLGGSTVGRLQRSGGVFNLTLPATAPANIQSDEKVTLDILVEAMGRQNFGCDAFGAWDFKGLQSPKIRLNGKLSVFGFSVGF